MEYIKTNFEYNKKNNLYNILVELYNTNILIGVDFHALKDE